MGFGREISSVFSAKKDGGARVRSLDKLPSEDTHLLHPQMPLTHEAQGR